MEENSLPPEKQGKNQACKNKRNNIVGRYCVGQGHTMDKISQFLSENHLAFYCKSMKI